MLVEAVPKLSTVGYLASIPYWEDARGAAVREAAKQAGISLKRLLVDGSFNEAAYQWVFASMEQDRPNALMVSEEVEHCLPGRQFDDEERERFVSPESPAGRNQHSADKRDRGHCDDNQRSGAALIRN